MQDLERQLSEVKTQNDQLKSMLGPSDPMDVDTLGMTSENPATSLRRTYALPLSVMRYGQTRENILHYGRQIFLPPFASTDARAADLNAGGLPSLPPKEVVDTFAWRFRDTFHATTPIVDLKAFYAQYERCRDAGDLQSASKSYAALLFAVLALGALLSSNANGKAEKEDLFNQAALLYTSDADSGSPTLDQCCTALILSVYCLESNMKHRCRAWSALAVSVATELGLHRRPLSSSTTELQMDSIVWLAVYSHDRLVKVSNSSRLALVN